MLIIEIEDEKRMFFTVQKINTLKNFTIFSLTLNKLGQN